MTTTGWGESPDGAPAMPLTAAVMANKERGPGDQLEIAAARSRAAEARQAREEAAAAPDPDEHAANMVARGLKPGMIGELSQRLGDTEAELSAEEEKIERAVRREEHTRQMHERGQIDAAGVAMRWAATDEGDEAKVERLRRRRDSLQRQLREASEAMAPPQERQLDGVEAASRHAHDTFVEVTRAKMAEAQSGRPVVRPVVRPFGSVSRGDAVRAEEQPVDCPECQTLDLDWEMSVMIHAQADLDGVDLPQRSAHGRAPMIYR